MDFGAPDCCAEWRLQGWVFFDGRAYTGSITASGIVRPIRSSWDAIAAVAIVAAVIVLTGSFATSQSMLRKAPTDP